jgi:hypothetical protein
MDGHKRLYFPPLPTRLDLELIETRTFSQVIYLR